MYGLHLIHSSITGKYLQSLTELPMTIYPDRSHSLSAGFMHMVVLQLHYVESRNKSFMELPGASTVPLYVQFYAGEGGGLSWQAPLDFIRMEI